MLTTGGNSTQTCPSGRGGQDLPAGRQVTRMKYRTVPSNPLVFYALTASATTGTID